MSCQNLHLCTPKWCWMLAIAAAIIALPGAPVSLRITDATAQDATVGPADEQPAEVFSSAKTDGGESQDQQDMLLTLIAAQKRAIDGLKSGTGRAKLRLLDEQGAAKTEIDVQVRFEENRYKLTVTYPPPDERLRGYNYDRRIVVNDGSATFVSSFSDRIHPAGCKIDVYENDIFGLISGLSGFKWQPNLLALLAVGRVEEFVERYPTVIEKSEDGTCTATAPFGKSSIATFVASPNVGFNITSFRRVDVQRNRLITEYLVDWKQKAGVWYVARIENRAAILDGYSHSVFEYVDFEPNARVEESSFTFEALEAIGSPRILDRRSPQTVIRNFVLPADDEVDADNRKSMALELEKMPLRYDGLK